MVKLLDDYKQLIERQTDPESAVDIYREALTRWTDVGLWDGYLTVVEGSGDTATVVKEFESAIDAVGSGFDAGCIWDRYMAYLHRELPDNCQSVKKRALAVVNAASDPSLPEYDFLKSFEDHLQTASDHLDYARIEQSRPKGNMSRARYVYERALCRFPTNFELWMAYLDFSRHSAKLCLLYERALELFPESVQLWNGCLRAIEKSPEWSTHLHRTFKQALVAVPKIESQIWLALTYLGIIRRKDNIHAVRDRVSTDMRWLCDRDQDCHISFFLVDVFTASGDTSTARDEWEAVIKKHSSACAFWLKYIDFARAHCDRAFARLLFKRACSAVSDSPDALFSSWLDYENKFGDLAGLEEAEERIKKQQQIILSRELNRSSKKRQLVEDSDGDVEMTEAVEPSKQPRNDSVDNLTLYFSNLDYTLTALSLRAYCIASFGPVKSVRLPKSKEKGAGRSRGFAYVDFADEDAYNKALESDKIRLNGRPVYITRLNEHFRPIRTTSRDPKTLFVSHIPHYTTEDDIRKLFSDYAGLTQVRMVVAKSGRARGCAYVEFDSADCANAALAVDGTMVGNARLSVAISDPSQAGKKTKERTMLIPTSLVVKQ